MLPHLPSYFFSVYVTTTSSRTQLRPGSHSTDQSGGAGEALPRYLQQVQEIEEYLSSLQSTNAQTIRARQERTQNERSTTGAMPPLGRNGGTLRSETTSSRVHNAPTSRSPASIGESRHAVPRRPPGRAGGGPGAGIGASAGVGSRAGAGGRASHANSAGGRAGGASAQQQQQPSSSATTIRIPTMPGQGRGGTQRGGRSRSRTVRIDRTGDGAMGDVWSTVQSQTSSLDCITNAVAALSRSMAAPVVSMRSLPDILESINGANARLLQETQRLTLSLEPAEYVAQARRVEMIREEIRLYQMELGSFENFMRQYQSGGGGFNGGGGR